MPRLGLGSRQSMEKLVDRFSRHKAIRVRVRVRVRVGVGVRARARARVRAGARVGLGG